MNLNSSVNLFNAATNWSKLKTGIKITVYKHKIELNGSAPFSPKSDPSIWTGIGPISIHFILIYYIDQSC